jgi:hypothetical protein
MSKYDLGEMKNGLNRVLIYLNSLPSHTKKVKDKSVYHMLVGPEDHKLSHSKYKQNVFNIVSNMATGLSILTDEGVVKRKQRMNEKMDKPYYVYSYDVEKTRGWVVRELRKLGRIETLDDHLRNNFFQL